MATVKKVATGMVKGRLERIEQEIGDPKPTAAKRSITKYPLSVSAPDLSTEAKRTAYDAETKRLASSPTISVKKLYDKDRGEVYWQEVGGKGREWDHDPNRR